MSVPNEDARRQEVTELIVQARTLVSTIASKMEEIQRLLADPEGGDDAAA